MNPGHTTMLTELLERLRRGDTAAREQLLEHACERLRLLARRMLRGFPKLRRWEETDDVFVEALTKLHRSLASITPESPRHFYNLAATQTRRVLLDLVRRHFGPQGVGAHHDSTASAGRRSWPAAAAEPRDLAEWSEFHRLVEELPEDEREVFNLLWYGGMTQPEAARALGKPERTVKRIWQRARIRLHQARQGEPLPE